MWIPVRYRCDSNKNEVVEISRLRCQAPIMQCHLSSVNRQWEAQKVRRTTLRTVIHANTWHEELIRPHGTHHTPLLPVACQTETRYHHYLRKSSDARPKSGPAVVFARRKIEGGPHLYLKPIENKRVFRASKFSPKNLSRITFGELLPFNCQTILPFRSSELIVD